jgi:hypothetical protein
MNKKIQTYSDLLEEKERLETLLTVQKQHVKNNWAEMKEEMKPVQNTFNFLGKLTKRDRSNPLLNFGIDVAGDVLLRRIVLARADWVTKLLLPVFVKNLSSNVFNKPGSFIQKIKSLWKKEKHPTPEEQFTERDLSEPEIEAADRETETLTQGRQPAYSTAERTGVTPE